MKNIYLTTTLTAIIGTIVYYAIAKYFYSGINLYAAGIFFAVFWIVYYFIAKQFGKKYYK